MLCNHIRNCRKVKKGSLFSVRVLALKPRAGGLWAYGFAVLYFCKIFSVRGPQAGADERGFRDATLSVALFACVGIGMPWGYLWGTLSATQGTADDTALVV